MSELSENEESLQQFSDHEPISPEDGPDGGSSQLDERFVKCKIYVKASC
jgi:hypothetical protein